MRPRWRERGRAGPRERERAGIAGAHASGSAQARDFSAWMARDTEIHSYYVRRELARESRRQDSSTNPTSQNSEGDGPTKRETTDLRRRLPQQSKGHRNKKSTGTSLSSNQLRRRRSAQSRNHISRKAADTTMRWAHIRCRLGVRVRVGRKMKWQACKRHVRRCARIRAWMMWSHRSIHSNRNDFPLLSKSVWPQSTDRLRAIHWP